MQDPLRSTSTDSPQRNPLPVILELEVSAGNGKGFDEADPHLVTESVTSPSEAAVTVDFDALDGDDDRMTSPQLESDLASDTACASRLTTESTPFEDQLAVSEQKLGTVTAQLGTATAQLDTATAQLAITQQRELAHRKEVERLTNRCEGRSPTRPRPSCRLKITTARAEIRPCPICPSDRTPTFASRPDVSSSALGRGAANA